MRFESHSQRGSDKQDLRSEGPSSNSHGREAVDNRKMVERRRCGTKSYFKAKSAGPTGLNFYRGFDPRPYGRGC
jgi:hypothetical protein